MSKSGYSFGADEFDQPAPHGAPVGVHRAVGSRWRKVLPFLLVTVIFAGLAFGGFYFWLNRGGSAPSTASSPVASADATNGDAGAGENAGEDEGAPAEPAPEEAGPAPDSEEATGAVNKAASIRVLNGAGIQGLAGEGADTLTGAGYTAVTADDYEGAKLPTSTIYYKTPEMQATANDIAAQFGIPVDGEHVLLVPENQAEVSVILMEDYRG